MPNNKTFDIEDGAYSYEDISQIARKSLKSIVSKGKPPIPPIYEEEFYKTASNMGMTELVEKIMANVPTGQVAALLVKGLEKMVHKFNLDLSNYDKSLDNHTGQIEKDKAKVLDENLSVDAIKEVVDSILKANMQMKLQLAKTRERLKEREQQVSNLRHRTRLDPLIGCLNRGAMEEDLFLEFARSKRYKRPFSVVMGDIDYFKKVNDTYGHLIGDEVLKSFSRLIFKQIRDVDEVYRYGGEEFLILLRETDLDGACIAAERIRQTVENHILKRKGTPEIAIRITASFGVSVWRNDDTSYKDIIIRADEALYYAKEAGRNQVASK